MTVQFDVLGIGNALVDVVARAEDGFLAEHGMAKGAMRGYCGRLMFPEREEWFDRHGGVYFWYTPLATWVWLYAFLGSAGSKTIRWRGYVYNLVSRSETRELERPE